MTQQRFDAIAPLLVKQPYIQALSHEDDAKGVTHDFADWRQTTPMRVGEAHNLTAWQGDHFGIKDVDLSPWLSGVFANIETQGRAVFARSKRYHGQKFDWFSVINQYPNATFLGFRDEYEEFVTEFRCRDKVSYRATSNLLEVAELIAGSTKLVSNQTCAFWIAIGIGQCLLQESDICNLNSLIRRPNTEYRY